MLFSWRIFAADFRGGFSWRISSGGFCGGFPWRISVADFPWRISVADLLGGFCVFFGGGFAADFSKSCGGFCGGFLRRILSGPKPCKLHVKIAPKIHHKNPPHTSPHARLVCDYTLPAFFTACFAACPSTGILHYVTYTADFFRGGFCAADFFRGGFLRGGFCAADFFRGGFLPRRISCAASGGHLSLHIRRDWGRM